MGYPELVRVSKSCILKRQDFSEFLVYEIHSVMIGHPSLRRLLATNSLRPNCTKLDHIFLIWWVFKYGSKFGKSS